MATFLLSLLKGLLVYIGPALVLGVSRKAARHREGVGVVLFTLAILASHYVKLALVAHMALAAHATVAGWWWVLVIPLGLLVCFLISQLDNEVAGKSLLVIEILNLLLVSTVGFLLFSIAPSLARPLVGWIYAIIG